MTKLPVPLVFDWNEGNRDKNLIKHNVQFKESEEVFFNEPIKFLIDKKHSQKENRFFALGLTNKKRKLIISFAFRGKKIRIISARDQSKKERRLYEEKFNS